MKLKLLLANITSFISLKLYYRLSYFHNRGRFPDLRNPTNLSEFIISEIVSGKINQYAPLADKYLVRDFVTERGLSHILPKLYGHWTDANEIDFGALPNRFVLKQNAGCELNIICFDKTKLNIRETVKKLNEWMRIKTFARSEPHYDHIEKCIICEELIGGWLVNNCVPNDYKFLCVNGSVHSIFACTDRDKSVRFHMFDLNWNRRNDWVKGQKYNDDIPRPKNLEMMIKYATILSQGFKFVRVDLYDTGNKVFFGELTFTPHGGLLRYYTTEALEEMWNFNI
jgi:hypothetical protein